MNKSTKKCSVTAQQKSKKTATRSKKSTLIVKVQRSLYTSDGIPDMMVYAKDRVPIQLSAELAPLLLELMEDEYKVYMKLIVVDGMVQDIKLLKEQNF